MPDNIIIPLGGFSKSEGGSWHCGLDVDGVQINVWASDVDDQPDPVFVARVPEIVHDLPTLEQNARDNPLRRGDSLMKEQRIVRIFAPQLWNSSGGTPDFALQFHCHILPGHPDFDEITFVDYKGGVIVGWCRID